jgi:hypothetical protein
MLQVLAPVLMAAHLSVAPAQVGSHIVVTPQIQGGPVTAVGTLQRTIRVQTLQAAAGPLQAPTDSLWRLQPAVGQGIEFTTLQ